MATPTPVFPTGVATDADLKVANNLIRTTLKVAVDAANTVLFVNSAAGFVANSLISVDNEIISIASVVASPNPQLIVAPGGRGFDGTQAAAHAAGAKVSMFIDAWHHNALAAEIKAIEEFIGPGGHNIGSGYPFLVASAFHFGPQTPGVPLAPGNNVITLAPVPTGVNGSGVGHYLWISGGTGIAEAVPITGGTAVSGAPSGTVIINCANAHSGAWTIASATGGLQEAANTAAGGSTIIISQDIALYANVAANGKHLTVQKFPGAAITNPTYFNIFGNHNAWGVTANDERITTDGFSIAAGCAIPSITFLDASNTAAGAIFQSTNDSIPQSTGRHTLWVQQDFMGTSGTPVAIRGTLMAPYNTSSFGEAAVAGYAYLGWSATNVAGSGTEGIGIHGQADVLNGKPGFQNVGVGVNAEGSYTPLGTDPGPPPVIIGVVSNIGTGNTSNAVMIGMQVMSNPNPAGANIEGGVRIGAKGGTHQYGLKIIDDGGVYNNPFMIYSAQGNAPAVNIVNSYPGGVTGQSFINFFRGDNSPAHALGYISSFNPIPGDYGTGVIRIATANAGTLNVGVTIDQNQTVTVAKNLRTPPIPVAQLPPSAGNIGSWACVNDATATTAGSVVTGGGANTVAVFCTPTGWKIVMS